MTGASISCFALLTIINRQHFPMPFDSGILIGWLPQLYMSLQFAISSFVSTAIIIKADYLSLLENAPFLMSTLVQKYFNNLI